MKTGMRREAKGNSSHVNAFGVALCVMLLAPWASADGQQMEKVPRIGILRGERSGDASAQVLTDAFRRGLRDLGYIEEKNISLHIRWAEGKRDRYPELAADLVKLNADCIVAGGGMALVAKNATPTIPIVMVNVADPVGFGFVASLARPGGNMTGLSSAAGPELGGKRLELLKETVHKGARVAVLWDPGNPGSVVGMKEMEAPARSLGIDLQSLGIREPKDLEQAFSAIRRERADALRTVNSPFVVSQLEGIVALATKSRIPAMYDESRWVEAGGLLSYGPSYPDLWRRAAVYVDKILKGAKPADLPVEQPTKFEFLINLKAAKQIGLTIPPNVLARADRVIR